MDTHQPNGNNDQNQERRPEIDLVPLINQQIQSPANQIQVPPPRSNIRRPFTEDLKQFYQLTGGSLFYCLSAVCVAYGIIKVLGPFLTVGDSIRESLPCILTLGGYELSLLFVLVLLMFKKVVDDALSLTVLIALFLVATSMALGSQVHKDISAGLWLAVGGIVLAFLKYVVMRRFVRIPFRALSLGGLVVLAGCNYLGPIVLARSLSVDPSQIVARRDLWLMVWIAMFVGSALVLIDAMRSSAGRVGRDGRRLPFLQTPMMVCVFSLILVIASSVQQYAMSFIFALERVYVDYVPVVIMASLLALELLRHTGKKLEPVEIAVACLPMAAILLAIYNKSVLESGRLGPGLMCYPPVSFALGGMAIGVWGMIQRRRLFWHVVFVYGLGIILTAGYSPLYPYRLNVQACEAVLGVTIMVYALILRRPNLSIVGLLLLCVDLASWNTFVIYVEAYQLTRLGGLAGVGGFGVIAVYLLYGKQLYRIIQIAGVLGLVIFSYDYLPAEFHYRFGIVPAAAVAVSLGLWFRVRDLPAVLLLWAPYMVRLYVAAKVLAHWRIVIVGFLLLAIGAAVSLFNRPPDKTVG